MAAQALGEYVRDLRERANLSVRGAAAKAGISEGLWRQVELGYRTVAAGVQVPANPRPSTVRAMMRVVGGDISRAFELAGIEGEPVGAPAEDASYVSDRDEAAIAATLSKDVLLAELARRLASENPGERGT